MDGPIVLIAVIIAFGLFFVALPVAYDAYARYRHKTIVTCPEEQGPAEVSFDAPRAALGAALATSMLRIKGCSLWPRRAGCNQRCVK
jgi:hypothetical protein